ncbi:MAG: hypothetical protein ACLRW2_01540 [Parasutterella excrementihominis]
MRLLLELEQARTTVATARRRSAVRTQLGPGTECSELSCGPKFPQILNREPEEATNYGAIVPAGLSSEILLNRPTLRRQNTI